MRGSRASVRPLLAAVRPRALATQFWATGHGLIMLALTGVLPAHAVAAHAPTIATALFVAAGDDQHRCRRSVEAGWSFEPPIFNS